MGRHYSSARLFVWLRKKFNVIKPTALPWGGWAIWDRELKSSRPFAYFFTEALPDLLETPVRWVTDPINNLRYYIRLRFGYKTHYLHTGLKAGQWHELETRMLHGMFNELVNLLHGAVPKLKTNTMCHGGDGSITCIGVCGAVPKQGSIISSGKWNWTIPTARTTHKILVKPKQQENQ